MEEIARTLPGDEGALFTDIESIKLQQDSSPTIRSAHEAWKVFPKVSGTDLAWFIECGEKAMLCSIGRNEKLNYKVSEAFNAIQRVKICRAEQQYYMLGAMGRIKGSNKEAVVQQVRNWFSQYQAANKPKRIGGKRTRREINLMSDEENKNATHIFISNIPIQFKGVREQWLRDMQGAILNAKELPFPFSITDTQLPQVMSRVVESHDNGQTFGIIVELDQVMRTGPSTMPVHFDIRGPERDALKGERHSKYMEMLQIRTRYLCHMFTRAEAMGIQTARVQCVMRGCSTETSVNNFLRHVVMRFIAVEKRWTDRVAVVHIMRHNLGSSIKAPEWKNETVVVVYALNDPTIIQLDEHRKLLGMFDQQSGVMEYGGVVMEIAKNLISINTKRYAECLRRKAMYIVFSSVWKQLTHQEVTDIIVKLLDMERILFWFERPSFRGRPRQFIVGISGSEEIIVNRELGSILADTSDNNWIATKFQLPYNENIGFREEVIELGRRRPSNSINPARGVPGRGGISEREIGLSSGSTIQSERSGWSTSVFTDLSKSSSVTANSPMSNIEQHGAFEVGRYEGGARVDVQQIMSVFHNTINGMKAEMQTLSQRVTNMAIENAHNEAKQKDMVTAIHARFDDAKHENKKQMEDLCHFMLEQMRKERDRPIRIQGESEMVIEESQETNQRNAHERTEDG
jgi:hypothetical protein